MKTTIAILLLALPLLARAEEKSQFYVAAGPFSPAGDAQFVKASGQYGFALGGGGRFSKHFSWDIDFLYAGAEVDTPKGFVPPSGTVFQSARADLETRGIGGIVKGTLPVSDWLEVYAGAGLGRYSSSLTVHRTRTVNLIFIPPFTVSEEVERSSTATGVQWLAGANVKLSKQLGMGVQWRRLDLKARFGPEVSGEVNVGGSFGLLYGRWLF